MMAVAGETFSMLGSDANAGGAIGVFAENIDVQGAVNSESGSSYEQRRSGGFLSSKRTTTNSEFSEQTVNQSTLSGDTVLLSAEQNITALAANIVGTGDVLLDAGEDITIGSIATEQSSFEETKVKKSGISLGGGGLFIGSAKARDEAEVNSVINYGSLVGSENGNVTLNAGGAAEIVNSQVFSTQETAILAESITIRNDVDRTETRQESEQSSWGLTIGGGAPLLDGARQLRDMTRIASETDNARVAGIAGAAGILSGKNTVDAVNRDPDALGGATLTATIGFSKSEYESTQVDETVRAADVSGASVVLQATGAGEASTIDLIGSSAGGTQSTTAIAEGDINIVRATENDSEATRFESTSASIGGSVQLGSGGAGTPRITAQFSNTQGSSNAQEATQREAILGTATGDTVVRSNNGGVLIDGSQVLGRSVDIEAESLTAISRQDTAEYTSDSTSIGGGVSYTFGQGFSGNVNYSDTDMQGDFASVQEQAGVFAGEGGFDIRIDGETRLDGAVLHSDAEAANNRLATGSLATSDIINSEEYSARTLSMGAGIGGGVSVDNDNTTRSDGVGDRLSEALGGVSVTAPSVARASGSQESTSYAGVSEGTIIIGGEDRSDDASINRDTANAANALEREFTPEERTEIERGFAAQRALTSEVTTFFANRAREEREMREEAKDKRDRADDPNAKNIETGKILTLNEREQLRAEANTLESEAESGRRDQAIARAKSDRQVWSALYD